MTIYVPPQYEHYVLAAAKATGLPPQVVAAQINDESGFNPDAVSDKGAEGIAQFEPGTFAEYGHGSPFNVGDAFAAYQSFMGTLLRQYKGNVQDALAAYNAGPGDLAAGMGYADTILSAAGEGYTITSSGVKGGKSSSSGGGGQAPGFVWDAATGILKGLFPGISWGQAAGDATSLDSIGAGITALAGDFEPLGKAITWFSVPSNEVRILCGVAGAALLMYGLTLIAREART